MKKSLAVLAVLSLIVLMLAPVCIGVNISSVTIHTLWADGGGPAPPFPWSINSNPIPRPTWDDGGGPAPPFPWSVS
jgi:hypothetical protein